ncbi:MAG: acyl-CoA dehydrogenase [Alphaproteobacteria bacterium]|nr:acyl-CoA dehydrogenase [Alphaproteobacteria bacterium]
MSDDNIIIDATTRIFQDLCDPQTVTNAADASWKTPLWEALEESGLTQAWTPDDLGGAGATIVDGFDVLRVSGEFAVPVPLAETLLAGWLLSRAGIVVPPGAMTIAPARRGEQLTLGNDGALVGKARDIPFAGEAEKIAVIARRGGTPVVALVDRAACAVSEGSSLAGDPRNSVGFDGVVPQAISEPVDGLDEDALMQMGAAVRAAQMAGALQAILDISVEYSKERVAFERPIGKFQAVQHNLARLGGEAAAAIAAAGSLADTIGRAERFDDQVFLEVASAKIRVGEAAGEGAAIAHQAHGAIGFTAEHILHRFTTRLWSWRDDFGSESVWAVRLGEMVAARGADELWPMVATQ